MKKKELARCCGRLDGSFFFSPDRRDGPGRAGPVNDGVDDDDDRVGVGATERPDR